MWVATPGGFFSVVAHRDEPSSVLVRARARDDLFRLADYTGPLEIRHTPDADYRWRAVVPREHWATALVLLAAEIDYSNFKDAVARRQGHRRAAVYHEAWSALRALQH